MAIPLGTILKYTPLAAVFMTAASVASQSVAYQDPLPKTATSLPEKKSPAPKPVAAIAAPLPPPDPVKHTVDTFRTDFLSRVADNKETLFNKCFTRDDGPVDPFVVNLIRAGSPAIGRPSLKGRQIDYTLPPIIILDPGHGAAGDRGANENGLHEVSVIDALTPKIKAALEQKGAYVVLTREGNLGSEYKFSNQNRILQWRAELAYELAAAFPERPLLMLSVHADITDNPDNSGAGVFYYGGSGTHSPLSADFAYSLARHYRTNGVSMVKIGDYAVQRCVPKDMPVALLEVGFLKNPEDFAFMRGLVTQEKNAARAGAKIAAGIFDFIERQRAEQLQKESPVVIADAGPFLKQL